MKQRSLGIQAQLERRRLLSGAAGVLLVAAVEGCSVQIPGTRPRVTTEPSLRLAPLRAAPDRITQITSASSFSRARISSMAACSLGLKPEGEFPAAAIG